MDFGVYPTMFDYCLAMALLYFKEQKCDVVILETGLGGTYDSTNACGVPDVTVIAKIGFDHMAILGDTLAKIASRNYQARHSACVREPGKRSDGRVK